MTTEPLNWQLPGQNYAHQTYYHDTPVGRLKIRMQGTILCQVEWLISTKASTVNRPIELENWLNDYWLAKTSAIPFALLAQGTPFQHRVWQALRQIPYGQTQTYGKLAQRLKTSPRALANACRRNPFPLIIPCHRVLAKTGIGGYAGQQSGPLVNIKTALLQHEQDLSHAF